MKKLKILIIAIIIVTMCFYSGCTQESSDSDDDTTNGDTTSDAIVINIFQVSPSLINYGETANLSWKVTGATAVEINQDIGSLPLEGSRIISPTESTTYTLIASNDTKSVTATAYIMVVPGESAPNLAWTLDDADNTITFTSGSSADVYGTANDADLIFKTPAGTEMYVASGLGLTPTETLLSTKAISAGDVIKGFSTAGDWQMIWEPTDKLLGTLTFS